jgi:predicted DNA-binding protein (MmcQ/YjbR family)
VHFSTSTTHRRAPDSLVVDEEAVIVAHSDLVAYCLSKPGAWSDQPWEGDHVAKVGPRIFAFLGDAGSATLGLKCGRTREEADEWLARYPGDASAMPYIGRSGWNVLRTDGAIPEEELREAVDASYAWVVSKLPRKDRPA